MGHEIVYCGRCQTRLTSADFDKGRAVHVDHTACCVACLVPSERAALEKSREAPSGRAPATSRRVPVAGMPGKSRLPWILAGGGGFLLLLLTTLALLFRGGDEAVPPAPPAPPPAPVSVVPKKPDPVERDLDALRAELSAPLSRNDLQGAQGVVDRAKGKHPDPRWEQAIGSLERDLGDRARRRFREIFAAAEKAADRPALDAIRAEITGWGTAFEALVKEFDGAFGSRFVVAPPPPAKPVPVVPPPPPPKPVRPYDAAWEKAMLFASRRDYRRAAMELKAAGKEFEDEEIRKENAADLQDVESLAALYADILKVMAALPAWEGVDLELLKEDGSRVGVKGKVFQAGPERLELHGAPRFVEHEDVAASSLARIFAAKGGAAAPERALLLFRALDGDLAGIDVLPAKVRSYAEGVRGRLAALDRKNEWAAKALFHDAEGEFRLLETRGAAMEKYAKLQEAYADTEFMKRNAESLAARREQTKDYLFASHRLTGKGVFSPQSLQVGGKKDRFEMLAWRSGADRGLDDPGNFVEARFYALPSTEYKAWALVGGCCTATFAWYVQASELTTPDRKTRKPLACDPGGDHAVQWEHRIRNLSSTHGGKDHAKAPKEPSLWEWAELPLPKFASGGIKGIRLIGSQKGMAVAALSVSASRDRRPADEELRKLAVATAEEGVPTGMLRAGKDEPDLLPQIREAKPYLLLYDLDLAKLSRPPKYDVDNRAAMTRPFDRIAYLLELQQAGKPGQYVFVSMDAFTEDPAKTGIPQGWMFQQMVSNLNVHSNLEGVVTGLGMDGGNLEIWPSNYGGQNTSKVQGASDSGFDFGDGGAGTGDGHGSFQVHNYKAGQTLFSINKWGAGGGAAEIGIGNNPAGNKDWTFASNGGTYAYKRLRVLLRPKA